MTGTPLTSTFPTDTHTAAGPAPISPASPPTEVPQAMSTPVLAADRWASNAELIASVAQLGYLRPSDLVLDATYGRGVWWKVWRPECLITNDLFTDADVHADFRHLPFRTGTFNAVAYDPPYVSVGSRTKTGIPEMYNRYGLIDAPRSPAALQLLMNDGLTEMERVVKPKGVILVKCQAYISSGQLWPGDMLTQEHAYALHLKLVDVFRHVGDVRPQPKGRRQVHARQNVSTLFIFQKPSWSGSYTKKDQAKKRRIIQKIKLDRGCADCGFRDHPDALDFDHRPGETKLLNIGTRATTVALHRTLAEIEKCDVVCSNCHRIRTADRRRFT